MPLTVALAVVLLSAPEPSEAPSFGFDRVDLLSEEPGTWLHYDVPLLAAYPTVVVLRWAEQIKPVFRLPMKGLYLGVSISSQSLVYESALLERYNLFWTAGLQTRLLFPTGLQAGLAWRFGYLRIGLSLSAFTDGGWGNIWGWTPQILPTLGVGVGPKFP
jgi:hypothetical protein